MYIKEIALAGLLHDIGKFYQKARQTPINNIGGHPKVSKEFIKTYFDFFNNYVDANVLMEFVARHHEQYFEEEFLAGKGDEKIKNYTYMVAIADNISSKERDENQFGKKDFRVAPLDCVFNRVDILNKGNKQVLSYRSGTYNVQNIFPKEIEKNTDYNNEELVKSFTDKINLLVKNPPKNFNHLMIIMDNLLKKYIWCIPASSQDIVSDISLYDHLKTSSAIATSLYLYQEHINKINRNNINNHKDKHLLVGFNFSSIQNYIMMASNCNKKGVSRQLRSRSFFVDMISEAISIKILEKFNLPIQNRIFLIGGKCFILMPNIDEYLIEFKGLMKQISLDLYEKYKGDICINYDYIKINKYNFENYGEVLDMLTKKLEIKRTKPFLDTLIKEDKWDTNKFILYNDLKEKTLCNNCGKRIINKDEIICEECDTQIKIGAMLPKSKYVLFKKSSGYNLFLDECINLVEEITNDDFYYSIKIDYLDDENNINLPVNTKYMVNYIPVDENNNTLTFEQIAEKSKGTNKLALIKIDIDNLSYILKEGFKKDDKNFATISRVDTFSRMIDMFFTNYIKEFIRNNFEYTYCVYSGGDDLLLIAPFSDAVALTRRIMLAFNEYVGKNEDFTLSTSVVSFSPKTHISVALDECNRHLQVIKNANGNKIYFMGEYFTYNNFTVLFLNISKIILKDIDKIDINVLRRISKYSDMYRNFYDKKDVMELMFAPLFDRDIDRNYNGLKDTEFYKYIIKITKNIADYRKKNIELYYIKTVIKYILLITKEERQNGI